MIVAEMSFIARRGEEEREAGLTVHLPEVDPKCPHGFTFRTLVELNGFNRQLYVHGEGSLQSLALAFAYIRVNLEYYTADGWQFYYPDSDGPLDPLLNLFPANWIAKSDVDTSET
jgi:hypothetical protein